MTATVLTTIAVVTTTVLVSAIPAVFPPPEAVAPPAPTLALVVGEAVSDCEAVTAIDIVGMTVIEPGQQLEVGEELGAVGPSAGGVTVDSTGSPRMRVELGLPLAIRDPDILASSGVALGDDSTL